MKNNFGGFALGLFGTIPIGSEFRIFGGLTFMIISIFVGIIYAGDTPAKILWGVRQLLM